MVSQTTESSQLLMDKVFDVPFVPVRGGSAFVVPLVVDVAVFMQRRWFQLFSRREQWAVPQNSSSTWCGSSEEGIFAAVLQHFSASVHPDVEAQGGGDAGSLPPRCGMCWLVLLVTILLVLCFRLLSMPVAIPQVQFLVKVTCPLVSCLVVLVRQCRKLRILCSCSPSLAVNIPCVPQTLIPMV